MQNCSENATFYEHCITCSEFCSLEGTAEMVI